MTHLCNYSINSGKKRVQLFGNLIFLFFALFFTFLEYYEGMKNTKKSIMTGANSFLCSSHKLLVENDDIIMVDCNHRIVQNGGDKVQ